MPPRLQNSQQEGTQNINLLTVQSHHDPATQGDQADQHEVNQESFDHRISFLWETLQRMQQAQFKLAESLRVMRETQGLMPQLLHEGPDLRTQQEKGSIAGNPKSGEQNASLP